MRPRFALRPLVPAILLLILTSCYAVPDDPTSPTLLSAAVGVGEVDAYAGTLARSGCLGGGSFAATWTATPAPAPGSIDTGVACGTLVVDDRWDVAPKACGGGLSVAGGSVSYNGVTMRVELAVATAGCWGTWTGDLRR